MGCGRVSPSAEVDGGTCVHRVLRLSHHVSTDPLISMAYHCLPPRWHDPSLCHAVEHDPSGTCGERPARIPDPSDPTRCEVLPDVEGLWIMAEDICGEGLPGLSVRSSAPGSDIEIVCTTSEPEGC